MIEKIIELCTNNRAIVLSVYLVLSIAGVIALGRLPVDAIPDVSENQVIVFTEWMGRSPDIVEKQITFPLSSSLMGLSGVKSVRSSSMFGMSFIFVIFDDEIDPYFARTRTAEKLATLTNNLPEGVNPELGPDGTGVGHIFWYTLSGENYNLEQLRSIHDGVIKNRLASVQGVAEVASIGGYVKEYRITVEPLKIIQYGISLGQVIQAVKNSNNEVGGNVVEQSSSEFYVKGRGYFASLQDIENTLIDAGTGVSFRVRDLAKVEMVPAPRRGLLDYNGTGEVVGGIIVMRSGENASEVIDKVKNEINAISSTLPGGISIDIAYDRSTLIHAAINTLTNSLWEAAIIVTLVVMVFLLHFRSIVRIIIEIPVTVLFSFLFMYVFGITSNIMSLGGIILAIGVIVDSSIVMVENSYRHMALATEGGKKLSNKELKEIAIISAKQVGRAIFFSDIIILVSFLPVLLLSGQEGKLFTPLVLTKTFMLLASAVVIITLIPVLMTFLMKGNFVPEEKNKVQRFFTWFYTPILKVALKYRKTTLALNVLALLLTIPVFTSLGSEFMPPLDEGSLLFMPVTLPTVSIEEVKRILHEQDKIIKSLPEVDKVLGKAGRAETATDNAPLNMIETIILLKPNSEWREGITKKDIIAELDSKLQIPGVTNGWTQPIINRINMLATGVRTDLGLKIFGDDSKILEELAIKAERIIREVDGASDVAADRMQKSNYISIKPIEPNASITGVNKQQINEVIESGIGGEVISEFIEGNLRFPITIRFTEKYRSSIEAIQSIPITVISNTSTASLSMQGSMLSVGSQNSIPKESGNSSRTVLLGSVAQVSQEIGSAMISSENGLKRSIVYFNAKERDMGAVMNDAQKKIENELILPTGYSIQWSGQYENKIRAQNTLLIITPIVLLSIFFLLYFIFKDFKEAITVMVSVPFALIGGVFIIYLLDYNISVSVWVGFIALYGIAVETGVVMVLYLHESLDENNKKKGIENLTNSDIYVATFKGSILRLRPKLMTVFTSMIGLFPVMWSTGVGADVMKPLTAPMIGGLITSAVHVLLVTPVIFSLMKEYELKKGVLGLSAMRKDEKNK